MKSMRSWDVAAYEEGSSLQTGEGYRLVGQLGDVAGWSVVDVGCGDGRVLLALEQAGARVLGVDASFSMVQRAHTRGVAAVVGRAEALPLSSNAWDLLFSNAALHWCLDHALVMRELVRVLRGGGVLNVRLGGPGNQWGTFLEAERLFAEPPFAVHRPAGFRAPLRMADPIEWFVGLTGLGAVVHRLEVETVDPRWPDADAMARWFRPIAHAYARLLPEDLRVAFVAEVVRRAWSRDPSSRAFVRVAIEASKRR